jgi:hypothetical protein
MVLQLSDLSEVNGAFLASRVLNLTLELYEGVGFT